MASDRPVAELFENVHVHGLWELGSLKSVLKTIWLLCLFGAFSGCCFHICPVHFKYNVDKVKLQADKVAKAIWNLDTSNSLQDFDRVEHRLVTYLSSLETLSYFKAISAQTRESDWSPFRDLFWDQFIGNLSYAELELELTHDFDDVVLEMEGHELMNKHKFMTAQGACYAFQINSSIPLALKNRYSTQFGLRRNFNTTYDDRLTLSFFAYNSDVMFFGDQSFFPQAPWAQLYQARSDTLADENHEHAKWDKVYSRWLSELRKDYVFDLLISSITFNRVNRRSQPCRDWSEQERSICMVQCLNDEFCSKMLKPCLLFHPNQTKETQYKRLCSILDDENIYFITGNTSHCQLQPEVMGGKGVVNDICKDRCPALCVEQVYYVTHARDVPVRIFTEGQAEFNTVKWANVTLRFHDVNRRLIVHERLSWQRDTFAATFASAVSLWTGVSGVAFAQITMMLLSLLSRTFYRTSRSGSSGQPEAIFVTAIVFVFLFTLVIVLVWCIADIGQQDDTLPVWASKDLWDVPGPVSYETPTWNWQYRGCISNPKLDLLRGLHDDPDHSAIAVLEATNSVVDVNTCWWFCSGFRFAGLQSGNACMCGDILHGSVEELDGDQCDQTCERSARPALCENAGCPTRCGELQCCGGTGALDLYEAKGMVFQSRARYLGCFTRLDFGDKPGHVLWIDRRNEADVLPIEAVNVNTCADFCKGYHRMGLLGGECVCADSENVIYDAHRWNPALCNWPCPNATIADCSVFDCDMQCGDTQCCGGLYEEYQGVAVPRYTSVYLLHSCTAIIENANPARVTAWVNESSNPVVCKDGYTLNGPGILHCNASKVWEEALMPTCV